MSSSKSKKQEEEFRIPADPDIAMIHYRVNKLGEELKGPKEDIETCPCCNESTKQPYSFFKLISHNTKHGSTIPAYFRFAKLLSGYLFIILLGSANYIIRIGQAHYDYQMETKGKVDIGMRLIYAYTLDFWRAKQNEIVNLVASNFWFDLTANGALILYSIYFIYTQKTFLRTLRNELKIGFEDYTVMIGNVKENDPKEKIERFLKNVAKKNGIRHLEIKKITTGTFRGNLKFLDDEIKKKWIGFIILKGLLRRIKALSRL